MLLPGWETSFQGSASITPLLPLGWVVMLLGDWTSLARGLGDEEHVCEVSQLCSVIVVVGHFVVPLSSIKRVY